MKKAISIMILSMLLLSVLLSAFNMSASATPDEPPIPEENYVWQDSNESMLTMTLGEINYSLGVIMGLYTPETIQLDQEYTIYIYVTRVYEAPTLPLALWPSFLHLCLGIGICSSGKVIHIGIVLWAWDLWTRHIPIPGCDVSLSTSLPNITYPTFLDIPLNEWDGPYEAKFTVGRYMPVSDHVPEVPSEGFCILLSLSILMVSLVKRRAKRKGIH